MMINLSHSDCKVVRTLKCTIAFHFKLLHDSKLFPLNIQGNSYINDYNKYMSLKRT
jgi:hypothetical protein